MSSFSPILLYVYGAILILGGLMGYIKAKSLPSLIAGGISGILSLLLGYFYSWEFAPACAVALAVVLTLMMARRFQKTRRPMPSLLIVGLSLLVAALQAYALLHP